MKMTETNVKNRIINKKPPVFAAPGVKAVNLFIY